MSANREQAELLLRKAREDEAVLSVLASHKDISDAVLGFHAQQAVEKAIKAVLAATGDEFPWTHDLQLLERRVEAVGIAVPARVHEARRLGPWAVEYRYGETLDETLDRTWAISLVGEVLEWASSSMDD